MSPFKSVAERLASRIRVLSSTSQIALLACAAEALMPRYLDWCSDSGVPVQGDLLGRAIEHAFGLATGGVREPSRTLLSLVEAATPSEPSDAAWFTAAQDSWICADSAIRVALEEFDAADGSWYLLEPMFQSVSESLFGVSDVGSLAQDEGESEALADLRLVNAVAALDQAIDVLEIEPVDADNLNRVGAILAPIRP